MRKQSETAVVLPASLCSGFSIALCALLVAGRDVAVAPGDGLGKINR